MGKRDGDRRTAGPGVIEVKGVNGQIVFDGTFVTITRKGLLARSTVGKGEKRIPLSSISAVQWKPAGLVRGFIQFTIPGGNERRSKFGSQSTDAAKDENSVLFSRSQMKDFEALRNALDAAITAASRPAVASTPAAGLGDLASVADMHARGLLTDKEFTAAKARLLGL